MNPHDLNAAIAKQCGWSDVLKGHYDGMPFGRNKTHRLEPVPSYHDDLDAMHEAERFLRDDEWDEYGSILHGVIKDHTDETTGCEANWHAEARFRAEAFAKLRGIWKG